MLHFTDVEQAQRLCECLAAPARVEIMRLVLSHQADSLDALAKTLHLTNGAITQHVKKLEAAGLIRLEQTAGRHGKAKRCVPATDRIIIDIATTIKRADNETFDIPIGQFSHASVNPYCAIACADGYVGERDDPRFFTHPDRIKAGLIYFNSGRIGWILPSPQRHGAKIKSISVSLELSSKPSGHGHKRDSAVTFYMNELKLGTHVIDGEFTDRKGLFTPPEFDGICQYGRYKTVRIDDSGTYLDGLKLGAVGFSDLDAETLTFSISTENGICIFGGGFGDYDGGLKCKTEYCP